MVSGVGFGGGGGVGGSGEIIYSSHEPSIRKNPTNNSEIL